MIANLQQLYTTRDLIRSWVSRTIQARYQQSYLGWLWAIVQPVASVAIFAVVFTVFVPVDTAGIPYILFSYAAMVPWTFFSSSLTDMTGSLVANMGLVTKIYFPREAIPISMLLARLLDFGVAASLIILMMVYYHMPTYPVAWLFLPLILLVQITLAMGLGLACAAMNVFYRDVDPLLKLGLQVWFYASPIIYPVSVVPTTLRTVYFLNPMAGVIEAYRDVLFNGRLPGLYLLQAAIISLVLLLLGYRYFKKVEYLFADIV